MSRVLCIGDLHCPYDRSGYLDFCKELYKRNKCDTAVFIGDIADLHAISYHEKHPEADGPGKEVIKAKEAVQKWYKAFPSATITIGNHDRLFIRKAATNQVPEFILKGFNEIWDTPGWVWVKNKTIDNVLYMHGEGCVDGNTEYLTPTGWKKISEYTTGDKIAQYLPTGEISYVKPQEYIKLPTPSNLLYHYRSKYGLSMQISAEHRVIYVDPKTNKLSEIRGADLFLKHNHTTNGFRGKFICVANDNTKPGINLTDDEIRVQVMFHADGHIRDRKTYGVMSFIKQRKIERAKMLLDKAHINYTYFKCANGATTFHFNPPKRTKIYDKSWWRCTTAQAKIISDEVMYWDSDIATKTRYDSKNKSDVDFIQYAFFITGKRSKVGYGHGTYRLGVSAHRKYVTMMKSRKNPNQITMEKAADGFKYCFKVPSGMFVARRDGGIFITGNCGGLWPAYNTMRKIATSCVLGHWHTAAGLKFMCNSKTRLFGMDVGCGIKGDAIQFLYAENNPCKPIISAGVIIDGEPQLYLMPMKRGEKYHDSQYRRSK
jgi:hypothetical protein